MRQRLLGLADIVAAAGLLVVAAGLAYSVLRYVHVPIRLWDSNALTVQGVVMEKLVERRPDPLLPFEVTTYVIRYAFPSAQGQMHTGEQVVTRAFYERVRGQGAPVLITFRVDNPGVNAIDPRLTLPGIAGWRAGMMLAALVLSYTLASLGIAAFRKAPSS